MTIRFSCPCGKHLQAAAEHVGLKVRCTLCGAILTVPTDAGEASRPVAPLAEDLRPPETPIARLQQSKPRPLWLQLVVTAAALVLIGSLAFWLVSSMAARNGAVQPARPESSSPVASGPAEGTPKGEAIGGAPPGKPSQPPATAPSTKTPSTEVAKGPATQPPAPMPAPEMPTLPADTDKLALAKVNAARQQAGLSPVVIDPLLSKACLAHAEYLARNVDDPVRMGLLMHEEDPLKPGYSAEGFKAGKSSNIVVGTSPLGAVDIWMASFFHRVPILDPDLKRIGIGYALSGKWGWMTVMDVGSGKGDGRIILCPTENQVDVPRALAPGEVPDPIPEDEDKKAGYPITITFPGGSLIREVKIEVKDPAGKEVPIWLSTPEKPVDARFQKNTICAIPKDPLLAGTAYTVTVAVQADGTPWSKTWSFTTARE